MAKKGLGRGLSNLFPDDAPVIEPEPRELTYLKVSQIERNKNQPRQNFDKEKLNALADSIREHGLIQPIVVTKGENDLYTIVAGERRWRAAKIAGLTKVQVIIKDYSSEEKAQIALIENLQREDLNPIEEALGYKSLMDEFNLTQEIISQKIGKSRSAIANSLRLLTLEDSIRKLLISGEISSGHARAILSLTDTKLRLALTKRIIEDNLNVRQAEAIARQLQNSQKEKPEKKEKTPYQIELDALCQRLSSGMGTKVHISHTGKKGKIEIEYYDNDDLDRILSYFDID